MHYKHTLLFLMRKTLLINVIINPSRSSSNWIFNNRSCCFFILFSECSFQKLPKVIDISPIVLKD